MSSTRIAEVLEELPEVKEAAVCAITGSSSLEEIWVAIVPNGAIDIAAVKGHVKNYKEYGVELDEVFVVSKIPRGDLGKIQKMQLK